jgi:hypothetical protein
MVFADIKVGDVVYVQHSFGMKYGFDCLAFNKMFELPIHVTSTTKTQFIAGGNRFMKSNGAFIGGGYGQRCTRNPEGEPSAYEAAEEYQGKMATIKKAHNVALDLSKANSAEHALAVAELLLQARTLLADKDWKPD